MKRLPMYDGLPVAPVDSGLTLAPDRACTRCKLSPVAKGKSHACLPADPGSIVQTGGLLVVGDSPTKDAQRPFATSGGAFVRELVRAHWSGPVVFDYAVKCSPGLVRKMTDIAVPIRECRPYLREVVQWAQPTRVLAVGAWAVQALLGRSLDNESVRRGYGWINGTVPVFMAHPPLNVMYNKFLKRRYQADIKWALTTPTPRPAHVCGIVHVVETLADAELAELALEDQHEVLFDVETAGVPHSRDFTVLCAGVSAVDEAESDAWVWSVAALEDPATLAVLRRILRSRKVSGSNLKYDMIAAKQCLDIVISDVEFDTQLVRKLIEPTVKARLEFAAELVGMGGGKEEAAVLRKKSIAAVRRKKWKDGDPDPDHWCAKAIKGGADIGKYSYGLLPPDVLHRYNGRDVATSAAAVLHLRTEVAKRPGELACWESIYRRGVASFARIEAVGMYADRQSFEAFSRSLNVGIDELRRKFKAHDEPGKPFNPGSWQQVSNLLYNKLNLPKPKDVTASGGLSTDSEQLLRLHGLHPIVDQLMEFRRLEKLDGTYARGMIPHILSDGRIHPTFRLDGTETGRVSSENPNGQNIPRPDTVEGKLARDGFRATPGNVMISLDQSQIELRVAAGMSGDPAMIQIFKDGIDYHLRTAQLVSKVAWGIAPENCGKAERTGAKAVNFGLLYGKGDHMLAVDLNCTVDEAARIRRAILGHFKKLAKMIERLLHHCRTHGSIDVPWINGAIHTRPLYEAGGVDKWKVKNAENSSTNTPIQGRAAWYTIVAIPLIHEWLDSQGLKTEIVNTVHDSIMLDAPPDEVDIVIENCTRIMEGFDCWGVPLVVDADAGDRWGSLRSMLRGERYLDAQVRWAAEALIASKQP